MAVPAIPDFYHGGVGSHGWHTPGQRTPIMLPASPNPSVLPALIDSTDSYGSMEVFPHSGNPGHDNLLLGPDMLGFVGSIILWPEYGVNWCKVFVGPNTDYGPVGPTRNQGRIHGDLHFKATGENPDLAVFDPLAILLRFIFRRATI